MNVYTVRAGREPMFHYCDLPPVREGLSRGASGTLPCGHLAVSDMDHGVRHGSYILYMHGVARGKCCGGLYRRQQCCRSAVTALLSPGLHEDGAFAPDIPPRGLTACYSTCESQVL